MTIWKPRGDRNYPFDLDASERQQRFKTGEDIFPYPPLIGLVSGFLPLMDWRIWGQGYGKPGFGPTSETQPFPLNLQWQINIPGLSKMNYSPTGG